MDEEADERAARARSFVSKCDQIYAIRRKRLANEEIKKAHKQYKDDPKKFDKNELDKALRLHGSIADKDLGKLKQSF